MRPRTRWASPPTAAGGVKGQGSEGHYQPPKVTDPSEATYQAGIPTHSCRGGSKVRGQEGSEGHYQTPKVTDPSEAQNQAGNPPYTCGGSKVRGQGSEGHYQTPKVTDPKGIRPQ